MKYRTKTKNRHLVQHVENMSAVITFNQSRHTVTIGNITLKLQPLSFKLLERLAASSNNCVSGEVLKEATWGNVTVTNETLKQRVFVLRKSLDKASVAGISIEAIRGEGYRLNVESILEKPEKSNQQILQRQSVVAAMTLAAFSMSLFYAYSNLKPHPKPLDKIIYAAVNNRIVLWTNTSPSQMPAPAAKLYEQLRSTLTEKNDLGELQLIYSERQKDMLIPVQARKNRAALISYFEYVQHDHMASIRIQIIEPTTATILRSNIISYNTGEDHEALMQEHIAGILNLLRSGKLYLQKEQRENAQSHIWKELRDIANQS